MSRKTVSMIGNLTRDMMSDVMETSLKKPIQTGEFRKNPVEPAWRCPAEYIYELVKTEQFVMEYLKPKQAVTGRVILQLHTDSKSRLPIALRSLCTIAHTGS